MRSRATPPALKVPLQLGQLCSAVCNSFDQLPASRGSVVSRPVHLQCHYLKMHVVQQRTLCAIQHILAALAVDEKS